MNFVFWQDIGKYKCYLHATKHLLLWVELVSQLTLEWNSVLLTHTFSNQFFFLDSCFKIILHFLGLLLSGIWIPRKTEKSSPKITMKRWTVHNEHLRKMNLCAINEFVWVVASVSICTVYLGIEYHIGSILSIVIINVFLYVLRERINDFTQKKTKFFVGNF